MRGGESVENRDILGFKKRFRYFEDRLLTFSCSFNATYRLGKLKVLSSFQNRRTAVQNLLFEFIYT